MSSNNPNFPSIPEDERTPLIDMLLQSQEQCISNLEDEIQTLKKETKKPTFELLAWFKSTESKSRIHFLDCLHQGEKKQYIFNAGAFEYIKQHKLPKKILNKLEAHDFESSDKEILLEWLVEKGIKGSAHQRIITESAMIGSLLRHGIPTNMAIMRDDAGQFNVFDHVLCWIHTERLVHRLIPLNDEYKKSVEFIRGGILATYKALKDYMKKRKISGSTRSKNGRRCRDTFASLKKACRKHGISFWKYLTNGTSERNQIPPMTEIIQNTTCGL